MSSEAEIRRVLQTVEREILGDSDVLPVYVAEIRHGLNRLLPLLLAGQALATPYGDGIDNLIADWKSALRAAQSQGQEAEKGGT